MAGISTSITENANLFSLQELDVNQIRSEVIDFMVDGEEIIQCFRTIRDQVIFTNKRAFVVNVQGLTGKKVAYFSYPYSKVITFGIQTAGVLDIDSELMLTMKSGAHLKFNFKSHVDIKQIIASIQGYIL